MKKKFQLFFVATTLVSLCSCATIFTGSKQKVVIDANIKKAESVTIDGRKHKDVTFPYQVKVKKGFNDSYVTSQAEGYDVASLYIGKSFNGVTLLNILLGSVVGLGVDAATGAMMKTEYKDYELEFKVSEDE